jgi:transposase-like protein
MSRTRHTDQQKVRILRDFEHTDQSATAFCRQRGVSYQTLMNWRSSAAANLPLSEQPLALIADYQERKQLAINLILSARPFP